MEGSSPAVAPARQDWPKRYPFLLGNEEDAASVPGRCHRRRKYFVAGGTSKAQGNGGQTDHVIGKGDTSTALARHPARVRSPPPAQGRGCFGDQKSAALSIRRRTTMTDPS